MDDKRIRPGVWLAVLGSLVALVLVLALFTGRREPAPVPLPAAEPVDAPARPAESSATRSRTANRPTPTPQPVQQPEYIDGLVYGEIDLREALALMPDNLYWKLGAPTKDPEVLAEREAERKRRNEEYGRVLAGDASEDEVRAYYDYKKKLSSDYLEFAEFMARRHRDSDNKEFVGMLDLATKLHAEKLAALTGELEDALARARERAQIREDWRRQKEEFGPDGGLPHEDDEFNEDF